MKIKNIGSWAIAALTASVLVVPAAHSQREAFSQVSAGRTKYLQSILPGVATLR